MDIEHLAKLARLRLTDAEKEKFSKQMGTIIDYIEKLNELDTQNVEPTAHVLGLKNESEPRRLSKPPEAPSAPAS